MQILCLNKSSAVHPNYLSSLNLSLVLFFFFYAFAAVDKKLPSLDLNVSKIHKTVNTLNFYNKQNMSTIQIWS